MAMAADTPISKVKRHRLVSDVCSLPIFRLFMLMMRIDLVLKHHTIHLQAIAGVVITDMVQFSTIALHSYVISEIAMLWISVPSSLNHPAVAPHISTPTTTHLR